MLLLLEAAKLHVLLILLILLVLLELLKSLNVRIVCIGASVVGIVTCTLIFLYLLFSLLAQSAELFDGVVQPFDFVLCKLHNFLHFFFLRFQFGFLTFLQCFDFFL